MRDAWAEVWLLARRKPLGAVSAMIILGLVVVALLAPVLAPRDPYLFNLNERGLPIRMQAPTAAFPFGTDPLGRDVLRNRKSTRLNSSHDQISYAVFCLKKKN